MAFLNLLKTRATVCNEETKFFIYISYLTVYSGLLS